MHVFCKVARITVARRSRLGEREAQLADRLQTQTDSKKQISILVGLQIYTRRSATYYIRAEPSPYTVCVTSPGYSTLYIALFPSTGSNRLVSYRTPRHPDSLTAPPTGASCWGRIKRDKVH